MDRLDPPKGLRGKILVSIRQEEVRRAKTYLLVSFATASTSVLGVFFSVQYMIQGFYQSSFYSYFSLLFSDPDVMLSYWRELSLSLIETLPLMGVTLSLIAVAILLTSIRVFVNNARADLMPSFSS